MKSGGEIVYNSLVNIPAIYFDLDGTLLDEPNEHGDFFIRESAIAEIRNYQACGGQVGIATGRTIQQTLPFIGPGNHQIQPDLPLITFNGALTQNYNYLEQTITNIEPLDQEAARQFIEEARNLSDVIGLVVYGAIYTVVDDAQELQTYLFDNNVTNFQEDYNLTLPEDDFILNVVAVFSSSASRQNLEVLNNLNDDTNLILMRRETVELVGANTHKSPAISRAAADAGFDISMILYFGDSHNDLDILEAAGWGVAMGNCRSGACQAADEIIDTNHTDAIADYLMEFAITNTCYNLSGF
ncbi:MAG: HAD-IIB family hydrolase [Pseudomonadota bacterium]